MTISPYAQVGPKLVAEATARFNHARNRSDLDSPTGVSANGSASAIGSRKTSRSDSGRRAPVLALASLSAKRAADYARLT